MHTTVDDRDDAARQTQLLSALTRLMSHWTSLEFQRRITEGSGIDRDPATVRALYLLGILGGSARPSTIADELHLSRPSTSKLIGRMTDAGLLTRIPGEHDGRSATVSLTASGIAMYERLFAAGLGLIATAIAGWPDEDADQLAALLTRFVDGSLAERSVAPHQSE